MGKKVGPAPIRPESSKCRVHTFVGSDTIPLKNETLISQGSILNHQGLLNENVGVSKFFIIGIIAASVLVIIISSTYTSKKIGDLPL